MGHAKVELDAVSYSSAISACRKGGAWQQALWLLSAEVELGTIRYGA